MLREDAIKETVSTLEMIAYEMADLARVKEELEKRLAALLEHGDDGQRTYIEGKYKIVVKTGYNWSLDKETYERIGRSLSSKFDPVQKVTKYELNKKIIREAYEHATGSDLEILNEILSKKPSKLSVTISAGV